VTTRIYKIRIIYPEGCREPGWHPAVWTDPEYLATCTREQRREIRGLLKKPFKWPRERLFLSSSGAYHRCWLLRFYGAQAEALGSDPVTWPNPNGAVMTREDEFAAPLPWEADLAAEQARQEQERLWLHEHAAMYVTDTARVAAEHDRFR
jgi:hypothetical protein